MERRSIPRFVLYFFLAGALFGICLFPALGQTPPASSTATATATSKPGELEALAAPIALYPDQLLAKVLIASTYPLEIVEAARWRQQNKGLGGAALDSALANQSWDDSVKDLTHVPEVLDMMDKQIGWTQKLGDAVLTDQSAMLQAVQRLRAKAQANGKLTDTAQQKVVTENQTIIIQPAEPEKVYVPYYDSGSVYGAWGYSYPPYYWPPPVGYAYGTGLAFLGGMAIGAAFWGNGANWGGGNLYVNHFNNFNNINSVRNGQSWQHNVNHRRGVNYGNSQLRNKYGRGTMSGANGRRDFRGFDNNGLRGNGIGGNRGGISNTGFNRGGGFDGIGRGGQTRSFSNRGSSSLGSARSSGFRGGGGMRGGGGRGGGGRGGGGRGGGGRRR
jgi:Protein of unknown function (DUF3300)